MTNKAMVTTMQDRISDLFKSQILTLLEELFDEFFPNNHTVKIDRLVLNVGVVSYDEFENDVLSALEKELPLILSKVAVSEQSKLKKKTSKKANIELLQFYLKNGYTPWWFTSENDFDVNALVKRLLKKNTVKTTLMLTEGFTNKTIQNRMKYQLSTKHYKLIERNVNKEVTSKRKAKYLSEEQTLFYFINKGVLPSNGAFSHLNEIETWLKIYSQESNFPFFIEEFRKSLINESHLKRVVLQFPITTIQLLNNLLAKDQMSFLEKCLEQFVNFLEKQNYPDAFKKNLPIAAQAGLLAFLIKHPKHPYIPNDIFQSIIQYLSLHYKEDMTNLVGLQQLPIAKTIGLKNVSLVNKSIDQLEEIFLNYVKTNQLKIISNEKSKSIENILLKISQQTSMGFLTKLKLLAKAHFSNFLPEVERTFSLLSIKILNQLLRPTGSNSAISTSLQKDLIVFFTTHFLLSNKKFHKILHLSSLEMIVFSSNPNTNLWLDHFIQRLSTVISMNTNEIKMTLKKAISNKKNPSSVRQILNSYFSKVNDKKVKRTCERRRTFKTIQEKQDLAKALNYFLIDQKYDNHNVLKDQESIIYYFQMALSYFPEILFDEVIEVDNPKHFSNSIIECFSPEIIELFIFKLDKYRGGFLKGTLLESQVFWRQLSVVNNFKNLTLKGFYIIALQHLLSRQVYKKEEFVKSIFIDAAKQEAVNLVDFLEMTMELVEGKMTIKNVFKNLSNKKSNSSSPQNSNKILKDLSIDLKEEQVALFKAVFFYLKNGVFSNDGVLKSPKHLELALKKLLIDQPATIFLAFKELFGFNRLLIRLEDNCSTQLLNQMLMIFDRQVEGGLIQIKKDWNSIVWPTILPDQKVEIPTDRETSIIGISLTLSGSPSFEELFLKKMLQYTANKNGLDLNRLVQKLKSAIDRKTKSKIFCEAYFNLRSNLKKERLANLENRLKNNFRNNEQYQNQKILDGENINDSNDSQMKNNSNKKEDIKGGEEMSYKGESVKLDKEENEIVENILKLQRFFENASLQKGSNSLSKENHLKLFEYYLRKHPSLLKVLLLRLGKEQEVVLRVLLFLSEDLTKRSLALLYAGHWSLVQDYWNDINVLLPDLLKTYGGKELYEFFCFQLFINAPKFKTTPFSIEKLVVLLLQALSRKSNVHVLSFMFKIKTEKLKKASRLKGKWDILLPKLTLSLENDFNNTPQKIKWNMETTENHKDDVLYIKNAGLVLIAPFLAQYFNILEMTKDSKFKEEADALRAVHLLQYIASGDPQTPEPLLVFNKILCNLPRSIPVAKGIELTEKEKKTTAEMMTSILSHWKVLGSTTLEGLRGSFLLREAKLEWNDEEYWNLTVEKKAFDILLESLPWSYSIIQLPWMENRIQVTWQ